MHANSAEDLLSFRSLAQWVRAAAQCDIDLAPLLDDIGLSGALSDPASSLVERHKIEQLMHRCVELARMRRPDRYFPLALAESFSFEYSSDLEAFIATAPTLRSAAAMLDWLPIFYDPSMHMSLTEFGSQARLSMQLAHTASPVDGTAPFMEMFVAIFARLARTLTGAFDNGVQITFRHAPHANSPAYAAALSAPIEYEQPLDAIWFDRSLLDHQLRGALVQAHQASATRLAEDVQALRQSRLPATQPGVAGELTRLLVSQPELLLLDQDRVAQHLQMRVRTLQRRLGHEQTSYWKVVDQVRHQLAKAWLNDKRQSIDDISVRLGFSNRVGFTQAFHRWCQMTPAQYRQSIEA